MWSFIVRVQWLYACGLRKVARWPTFVIRFVCFPLVCVILRLRLMLHTKRPITILDKWHSRESCWNTTNKIAGDCMKYSITFSNKPVCGRKPSRHMRYVIGVKSFCNVRYGNPTTTLRILFDVLCMAVTLKFSSEPHRTYLRMT